MWLGGCAAGAAPVNVPEQKEPPRAQAPPKSALARGGEAPVVGHVSAKLPTMSAGQSWNIVPSLLASGLPTGELSEKELAGVRLRPSAGQEGLWVVIDEQAPRPLAGSTPLTELVLEDREFAPGSHALVVFRVQREDLTLQVQTARFNLDVAPGSTPEPWSCLLAFPTGTQNGASAADRIEVIPIALSKEVHSYQLALRGSAASEDSREERKDTQPSETPHASGGLGPGRSESILIAASESGDMSLVLTCLSTEVEPLGTIERTISVNRELNVTATD